MTSITISLLASALRVSLPMDGVLLGGNHYALSEDPFTKPSYRFAFLAAQFECREHSFVTCCARKVLTIWTLPQDVPKPSHAIYSRKSATRSSIENNSFNMRTCFSFLPFSMHTIC